MGKAIGGASDSIQSGYDFNNTTENKNLWEEERRTQSLKIQAQDDGTDPDAYDKYKSKMAEIDKKYIDRAYGFNDNVGRMSEKYIVTRGAKANGGAQQNYFNRFMVKSKIVQEEETNAQAQRAGQTGEFRFETAEAEKRISSMRNLWGEGNTQAAIRSHKAHIVEHGMNVRLTDPVHGPSFVKQLEADSAYQSELYSYIPEERQDAMNTRIRVAKEHHAATQRQATHEERERRMLEREAAIDETNRILVPIALKRNGLNRPSDLTAEQWSKLTLAAPEYAMKLQDSMRREMDYSARQVKADRREAEQERKQQLSENESAILMDDDFETRDLRRDLAAGDITPTQYQKLMKVQEKMDPIKRNSVKSALSKVNSGAALARTLDVNNKREEAVWRQKYGDLVKAFAYNYADEPDFDRKLSDFMEKHVFSEMVTGFFTGRDEERQDKYQAAQAVAGDLPARGRKAKPASTMPPAADHSGRTIRDTETGKRFKSDGKNWIEVK